jgi:hypothetical protein
LSGGDTKCAGWFVDLNEAVGTFLALPLEACLSTVPIMAYFDTACYRVKKPVPTNNTIVAVGRFLTHFDRHRSNESGFQPMSRGFTDKTLIN